LPKVNKDNNNLGVRKIRHGLLKFQTLGKNKLDIDIRGFSE